MGEILKVLAAAGAAIATQASSAKKNMRMA
jgi:hypothetical protein